jgi:hypothetical protein
MEDYNIENADSLNGNNQDDLDLDLDLSLDADAQLEAMKKQNAKLFERAKRAEGFEKQSDGSWVKKTKPQEEKPVQKNNISDKETVSPTDILDSDEFSLYREGYTNDEIKLIMRNGGRKALSDDKSPLVLGLQVAREQRKAEEASSNTSGTAGQSEVERKYTVEQMKNMKAEDLANLIGYAQ